jgi:beta-ribofuranosylaminobenzene 5'-phosphate synthase
LPVTRERPAGAELRLQTPSRLHLGIFDLPGGGYGGIGLAIANPGVRLAACPDEALSATGPQSERVLQAAEAVRRAYRVTAGAALEVDAAIPVHVGLGSGTQLSLATAALLARLWDIEAPLPALLQVVGRGARSRIGLEAFRVGGFVAHATWRSGAGPGTRVRHVPAAWRFVVAVPGGARGLSGEAEANAFAALGPMPAGTQQKALRLVEEALLPAVEEGDVRWFGGALTELQSIVGAHFAPVQGGRFAHPHGERIAAVLLDAGAAGVGQSSWGPAICGVAGSQAEAEQLATALAPLKEELQACWITPADNRGIRWEWDPRWS